MIIHARINSYQVINEGKIMRKIILKKATLLGLGILCLGNIDPVSASIRKSQVSFEKITAENLPPLVRGVSENALHLSMKRGNSMPLIKVPKETKINLVKDFRVAALKNKFEEFQTILNSFENDDKTKAELLNSRASGVLPMPLLISKIEQSNKQDRRVLNFLLETPLVDVNATYGKGRTALKSAILCDDLESAQLLLARNDLNLTISDDLGTTALHVAIVKKKIQFTQLILKDPRFNLADHFMIRWSKDQRQVFEQGIELIKLYLEKPTFISNIQLVFDELAYLIMGR